MGPIKHWPRKVVPVSTVCSNVSQLPLVRIITSVRAIYAYEAQGPDELGLIEGQTIELTSGSSGGQNSGTGWWEGMACPFRSTISSIIRHRYWLHRAEGNISEQLCESSSFHQVQDVYEAHQVELIWNLQSSSHITTVVVKCNAANVLFVIYDIRNINAEMIHDFNYAPVRVLACITVNIFLSLFFRQKNWCRLEPCVSKKFSCVNYVNVPVGKCFAPSGLPLFLFKSSSVRQLRRTVSRGICWAPMLQPVVSSDPHAQPGKIIYQSQYFRLCRESRRPMSLQC